MRLFFLSSSAQQKPKDESVNSAPVIAVIAGFPNKRIRSFIVTV